MPTPEQQKQRKQSVLFPHIPVFFHIFRLFFEADFVWKDSVFPGKKAALLHAAGYPADYLEPEYACSRCRDTGYRDGRKCICLKQRIVSLLYEQSNLKEILEKENFSALCTEFLLHVMSVA